MSESGAGGKKAKKESTPARKVLLQACQTFLSPLYFPQRLLRDFKKIQRDPPDGINAAPKDNNLFNWQAVIFGSVIPCVFLFCLSCVHNRFCCSPDDTPWEGGKRVSLKFSI
jgi:hypothetical protein